jgi:SAM-dependent methyltransferase
MKSPRQRTNYHAAVAGAAGVADATCPLCRSSGNTPLFAVQTSGRFTVVRCHACGLRFTWPRPTEAELADLYGERYFANDGDDRLGYRDYRSAGETNARRAWGVLKGFTDLDAVQPRRLLDVGCATGGFLAEASREGWASMGVEMSASAANSARRGLGLQVLDGDIASPDLPLGAFGLITMWHVLEHVLDPDFTLRRARDLLAPDGRLFIEVPNWDSVGRMVKGPRWSQMKPPEHINFFNGHILKRALARRGFRPVKVDTYYPSMSDKARVKGNTRALHVAGAVLASAASTVGRGGYLRALAGPD